MIKFAIPFLAITLAAPALAAEPMSFERDGIRYVVTVAQKGETRFIKGNEIGTGRSFNLRVKNGRVLGEYGGTPVSYRIGETQEASAPTANVNG